jgi:glyoxylase-like metal-dependent hydrolase (beta-lactamase superfamily II)
MSSAGMSHDTVRLGPHVEQWHAADRRAYPSGAPLVVTGRDGRMAIDSSLDVVPTDHDGFLLSHFHEDHVVGVAASGLPAFVHADDLSAVRSWQGFADASGYADPAWHELVTTQFSWQAVTRAEALTPGRPVDLGGVTVTPVHLPGHTPGHCGFLVEPDHVLYLGDIDLSSFGPYYGDATASLVDTLASLRAVREIDAQVYTTFHHRGHVVGRAAFETALDRHTAVIRTRHERVQALLDAGHRDADDMTGRGVVYRPGTRPPWGLEGERRMIELHLAHDPSDLPAPPHEQDDA